MIKHSKYYILSLVLFISKIIVCSPSTYNIINPISTILAAGVIQSTSNGSLYTSTSVNATTFVGALTGHASLDLPLTGGTMSGAINMGTNSITGVGTLGVGGTATFNGRATFNSKVNYQGSANFSVTSSPAALDLDATTPISYQNVNVVNVTTTLSADFSVTISTSSSGNAEIGRIVYLYNNTSYNMTVNFGAGTITNPVIPKGQVLPVMVFGGYVNGPIV